MKSARRFFLLILLPASAWALSPLYELGHPAIRSFVSWAYGYGALTADRRHVALYLSPSDVERIRVGTEALVRFGGEPESDIAVPGKVTDILRDADPRTGQAIVTIGIDPVDREPRTYASARLSVNARAALSVPSTAVIWTEGKPEVVRQVKADEFDAVPVTVGREDGAFMEILGGIAASDTILTQGALEWANRGQATED